MEWSPERRWIAMKEREGSVEVLLVEDNPGDARLTQEALKDSKYEVNVSVAEDGEIALARLRKEGEFAEAPSPEFILSTCSFRNTQAWRFWPRCTETKTCARYQSSF
jgi:CheY-like chemotaxis protein